MPILAAWGCHGLVATIQDLRNLQSHGYRGAGNGVDLFAEICLQAQGSAVCAIKSAHDDVRGGGFYHRFTLRAGGAKENRLAQEYRASRG